MEIFLKGNEIFAKNKKIQPCEALFLMEFSNAKCFEDGKELSIYELIKKKKISIQEYFFYRDAKLRGFNIYFENFKKRKTKIKAIEIKAQERQKLNFSFEGIFLEEGLTTIVKDEKIGKILYEKFWFGQYATYKLPNIGKLNKLDIFETCFLIEKGNLKIKNKTKKEVFETAKKRIPNFIELYQIFKDWREKGFVVKSGFKFGCDFRLYKKAKPNKNIHSKYVLHLLPKETTKVSELSRAIRVAHSVRKSFILAIPKAKPKKTKLYLIQKEKNKFLATYLFEQGFINFKQILFAIKEAEKLGYELVLAIIDRETSLTYYKLRRIKLETKKFNYFEIDWIKP